VSNAIVGDNVPIIDSIASALGGNIATGVGDIIKLFKIDPTVALQNQTELTKIQFDLQGKIIDSVTAQIQVNLAEAQSKSLFVAGWRPWIGWVCGVAFAYAFVLQPLLTFGLVACHVKFDVTQLPKFDISQMMPVLLGMLGLATARTVEKINGINAGQ
jgi:hypothetical protein